MRENGARAAALPAAMAVMPDWFAPPDRGPIIVARKQG
jgi:hypothetical protein